MRWIQFRSNGKFHLIDKISDIDEPQDFTSRRKYHTMCKIQILAYPDHHAARDKIYQRSIDEYCPKCLEKI